MSFCQRQHTASIDDSGNRTVFAKAGNWSVEHAEQHATDLGFGLMDVTCRLEHVVASGAYIRFVVVDVAGQDDQFNCAQVMMDRCHRAGRDTKQAGETATAVVDAEQLVFNAFHDPGVPGSLLHALKHGIRQRDALVGQALIKLYREFLGHEASPHFLLLM
ncbi:hypothetical protein D9M71_723910 [compost metagenome]